MLEMRSLRRGAAVAAGALIISFAISAMAGDIVQDWDSVKAPAKPELKAVTLEPATTALLIMDMMKQICGARPRCVASVPNVKRLHDAARQAGSVSDAVSHDSGCIAGIVGDVASMLVNYTFQFSTSSTNILIPTGRAASVKSNLSL